MSNFQEVTSFVGGKAGGAANAGSGLIDIEAGDILILDADSGEVLTGASNTVSTSPRIAIASCVTDGSPIISGVINGKALTAGSLAEYEAAVAQVSAFGYSAVNTTAGLPAEGDDLVSYSGAIVYETELKLQPNRQPRLNFEAYSKGGYDLASQIVQDINRDSDNNPVIKGKKLFTAIIASNGTDTDIAQTATVIKGSENVTFGGAHGLTAGDFVYFPNGGVYKVATVPTSATITLEYAYVGSSETYASAEVASRAAITLYGIQVTAALITKTNPVDSYSQIKFSIALAEDYGLTEDVITVPVVGNGTGWQVRDKEIDCMGWLGYTDRNDTKRNEFPFATSTSSNYNTVSLSSQADVRMDMEQIGIGPVAVFLAFDAAADTQLDAVMAILEPWASSGGVDLS